jgi:hypothetical protein
LPGFRRFVTVRGAYAGYLGFWRNQLKRFQVVAPGTLIRSGQPTEFGLRHAIEHLGVRTVVSLQMFDVRLHDGWFDPNEPEGAKESEFVRSLGARVVQWPMGDETCWPWPHAWELEEFFHLLDDPANRPVLLHCQGGRHRTGTFSALYRLEYDRWTPEQTLAEMQSFGFGQSVTLQEVNLTTYTPRPLPEAADWPTVAAIFGMSAAEHPAEAVPVLVHRIRTSAKDGPLRRALEEFVASDHPFALPLAVRVISAVDDPLLRTLTTAARRVLADPQSAPAQASAAAALIADYGSPDDQAALLDALRRELQTPEPSRYYEALVCGVTNRYTANRLPFLRPLLDDRRGRIEPRFARYTYAATAVCRVAAINDAFQAIAWYEPQLNVEARAAAIEWYAQNPAAHELRKLTPPAGPQTVASGDGPVEEDLSRMRR